MFAFNQYNHKSGLLQLTLLGFIAVAYWPGLQGGFLFDDFWNLNSLQKFGSIDNFETFLLYITSGTADPTGRPVSMLSFLPNASSWPNNPFPFKLTNLFIHLLNTILLFKVVSKIEKTLFDNESFWPAFLTAALWAAHPYYVSTVLYVIQRHAMLPMTFTLLACLCWFHAAKFQEAGAVKKAWLWAIFGVWGFTLLAGLSKANGFLAPAMILMIFLVSPRKNDKQRMAWITLGVPTIFIAVYLLSQLANGLDASGLRTFTLGERLLTQPRVLLLYVQQIFLPDPSNYSLFVGDSITVSKSLFEPLTTILAISAWAIAAISIFLLRHSFPRLFIAFFWYLIGQSLESSTIMLEIAFEHRNYLPAALIFYPFASALVNTPVLRKSLKITISASILVLMLILTAQQAILWGNPRLQAKIWEHNNANSIRTIYYQTSKNVTIDEVKSSLIKTIALQKSSEININLAMIRISLECRLGSVSKDAWYYAKESAVSNKMMNSGNTEWLNNATAFTYSNDCHGLSKVELETWLKQLLNNQFRTRNPYAKKPVLNILGNLELIHRNQKNALNYYNQALEISPDYELVLVQAASLGNANYEEEALAHIEYYRQLESQVKVYEFGMQRVHGWVLNRTGYMERELTLLEKSLRYKGENQH